MPQLFSSDATRDALAELRNHVIITDANELGSYRVEAELSRQVSGYPWQTKRYKFNSLMVEGPFEWRARVLRDGYVLLENRRFKVLPWDTVKDGVKPLMSTWIRIFDLPLMHWNRPDYESVIAGFGVLLQIDGPTLEKKDFRFAKLRIGVLDLNHIPTSAIVLLRGESFDGTASDQTVGCKVRFEIDERHFEGDDSTDPNDPKDKAKDLINKGNQFKGSSSGTAPAGDNTASTTGGSGPVLTGTGAGNKEASTGNTKMPNGASTGAPASSSKYAPVTSAPSKMTSVPMTSAKVTSTPFKMTSAPMTSAKVPSAPSRMTSATVTPASAGPKVPSPPASAVPKASELPSAAPLPTAPLPAVNVSGSGGATTRWGRNIGAQKEGSLMKKARVSYPTATEDKERQKVAEVKEGKNTGTGTGPVLTRTGTAPPGTGTGAGNKEASSGNTKVPTGASTGAPASSSKSAPSAPSNMSSAPMTSAKVTSTTFKMTSAPMTSAKVPLAPSWMTSATVTPVSAGPKSPLAEASAVPKASELPPASPLPTTPLLPVNVSGSGGAKARGDRKIGARKEGSLMKNARVSDLTATEDKERQKVAGVKEGKNTGTGTGPVLTRTGTAPPGTDTGAGNKEASLGNTKVPPGASTGAPASSSKSAPVTSAPLNMTSVPMTSAKVTSTPFKMTSAPMTSAKVPSAPSRMTSATVTPASAGPKVPSPPASAVPKASELPSAAPLPTTPLPPVNVSGSGGAKTRGRRKIRARKKGSLMKKARVSDLTATEDKKRQKVAEVKEGKKAFLGSDDDTIPIGQVPVQHRSSRRTGRPLASAVPKASELPSAAPLPTTPLPPVNVSGSGGAKTRGRHKIGARKEGSLMKKARVSDLTATEDKERQKVAEVKEGKKAFLGSDDDTIPIGQVPVQHRSSRRTGRPPASAVPKASELPSAAPLPTTPLPPVNVSGSGGAKTRGHRKIGAREEGSLMKKARVSDLTATEDNERQKVAEVKEGKKVSGGSDDDTIPIGQVPLQRRSSRRTAGATMTMAEKAERRTKAKNEGRAATAAAAPSSDLPSQRTCELYNGQPICENVVPLLAVGPDGVVAAAGAANAAEATETARAAAPSTSGGNVKRKRA